MGLPGAVVSAETNTEELNVVTRLTSGTSGERLAALILTGLRGYMNQRLFKAVVTGLISVLLGTSASAQRGGPTTTLPGTVSSLPGQPTVASNGSIIQLAVRDEKRKPLDRQALVQITNKTTGQIQAQVTQDDSMVTIVDLQTGQYELAVSALGYLTSHQDVMISGRVMTTQMQVELARDPSAIDLGAVNAKEMPSKVRKNMLHGMAALKSSKLEEAQKKLEAAYNGDPSNSDVNFLLGYLYFEKQDMERARVISRPRFSRRRTTFRRSPCWDGWICSATTRPRLEARWNRQLRPIRILGWRIIFFLTPICSKRTSRSRKRKRGLRLKEERARRIRLN